MLILFLILIVLALVILIANIAIVPQVYSYVVERLGVYYTTCVIFRSHGQRDG